MTVTQTPTGTSTQAALTGTQLTPERLKLYFDGNLKHRAYKETQDIHKAMSVHANGEIPEKLIQKRRPSESEETFAYRKEIYVPKTKNPVGKVISSLSKIRRSPDWSVKYDKGASPARIVPEETLEKYCEENFPGHKSITNWMFSVGLKNQCIDANAVIAVFPLNPSAQENEYLKPQAMIFNSEQVIFFEEGADFAILQSSERSSLIIDDGTGNQPAGKVFYVLTTSEYAKWEQDIKGGYQRTQYLTHTVGLPAFKIRSQFLKQKENTIIQESRLSLMLPSLDEAAREYSDLQASVVQHMHPLFWYFQSKSCQSCEGTGKVASPTGVTPCSICKGSGKIKFSPYAHLEVDPPKMGESALPFNAPAGYITRDVEIMKLQDERVKGHLYDALAAINMQFLDQTPLNISGEAKAVDREELNNFVYSVAEDLVWNMDQIYTMVNEWRNTTIVPDKTERKAMLPKISVPEQFDLLPADYLMDEIGKARTAKANPVLVAAMEEDYAVKKLYNNPDLASTMKCVYELDPLPGMTVDEKNAAIMNKGATQEDYVISTYIVPFVRRAMEEEKDFLSKSLKDKTAIMSKYAAEKTKVVDAAEQLKQELAAQQAAAQQGAQFGGDGSQGAKGGQSGQGAQPGAQGGQGQQGGTN